MGSTSQYVGEDVIVLHDLQGFSITPFHGEGTRAGTITTDLSPPGLGSITDITSRTDEVARCCNLLQASCTGMEDNPFPPFTNHSFEELCWQARESCRAMLIVLLNDKKVLNSKRENISRFPCRVVNSENQHCWLFWAAEISSDDGKKVLHKFDGGGMTERIIMPCSITGQQCSICGRNV